MNQCDPLKNRPKWLLILEWICVITGIIGLFITAHGDPLQGFVVSSIASLLFIVYNWYTKQYGMLAMSVIYLVIEIYGIWVWMQKSL